MEKFYCTKTENNQQKCEKQCAFCNDFESDAKEQNDSYKYKKQRNLLMSKISKLLIAINDGKITVFNEDDSDNDYIQDLEDAQNQIIKESVFNSA